MLDLYSLCFAWSLVGLVVMIFANIENIFCCRNLVIWRNNDLVRAIVSFYTRRVLLQNTKSYNTDLQSIRSSLDHVILVCSSKIVSTFLGTCLSLGVCWGRDLDLTIKGTNMEKCCCCYRVILEEDWTCLMVNDGQHGGEDGEQGEDDHQHDHQPGVCKVTISLFL